MKNPRTIWVWVGIAVVVIAVGAWAVWYFYGAQSPASIGPLAVHAPAGELIPGFPKELILDSAAQMNNSYSINYSSSTNQYTAEWVSSSSPATLYSDYQKYAAANGWMVGNSADTPSLKGMYAVNASSSAAMNVIIMPQGAGSKVTISYVVQ